MSVKNGVVTIWINAFIEKHTPGYMEIPRGEFQGKTALPFPKIATLHPLNTNPALLDRALLTDQRTFSSLPTASVRLSSSGSFRLYPQHLFVKHSTSGTTAVNKLTGALIERKDADLSDCTDTSIYDADMPVYVPSGLDMVETLDKLANSNLYKSYPSGPEPINPYILDPVAYVYGQHNRRRRIVLPPPTLANYFTMMSYINGQASDPLVRGAPNVDYDVSFVVVVDGPNSRVFAAIYGFIDDFPSFEAYAKYQDGINNVTKTLFRIPPPPGNTALDLFGSASRPVAAAVVFPSVTDERCRPEAVVFPSVTDERCRPGDPSFPGEMR